MKKIQLGGTESAIVKTMQLIDELNMLRKEYDMLTDNHRLLIAKCETIIIALIEEEKKQK
jgi:hypothetical protein